MSSMSTTGKKEASSATKEASSATKLFFLTLYVRELGVQGQETSQTYVWQLCSYDLTVC